jgi:hypothetical protein
MKENRIKNALVIPLCLFDQTKYYITAGQSRCYIWDYRVNYRSPWTNRFTLIKKIEERNEYLNTKCIQEKQY